MLQWTLLGIGGVYVPHSHPLPPSLSLLSLLLPEMRGRKEAGEGGSALLGEQEERNEAGVSGCSFLALLPGDSHPPACGAIFGGWGEKSVPHRGTELSMSKALLP